MFGSLQPLLPYVAGLREYYLKREIHYIRLQIMSYVDIFPLPFIPLIHSSTSTHSPPPSKKMPTLLFMSTSSFSFYFLFCWILTLSTPIPASELDILTFMSPNLYIKQNIKWFYQFITFGSFQNLIFFNLINRILYFPFFSFSSSFLMSFSLFMNRYATLKDIFRMIILVH